MNQKEKTIIIALWGVLFLEWLGLIILIYFARLPYFVSLFVAFMQLFSPVFLLLNVGFLIFTLLSKKPEFTVEFWLEYLRDLGRFLFQSFFGALALILISAIIGVGLGFSAARISELSKIESMREWVNLHFY